MKLITIFIFSSLLISSLMQAQDGSLDVSFDSDGKVTASFGSGYDGVKGIAIQSDGKIVVVGVYPHGTDDDFAVARYLSDGTLDAGFGTSGKVITSIGSYRDAAYSVAIQSDGKIVVVGATSNGTNNDIAIVRYTSAGVLDNTFDSDGIVTTEVGTSDNPAYDVAIQSDGKIVVVGYAHIGLTDDVMVARYNSDGSLDTGFDSDGVATTSIGSSHDIGNSVAIQSDGKIVVAGYTWASNDDFAVVRYNSNGTLDTGFDSDGIVTTSVGSSTDVGYCVAIQSDGKIVVAGYSNNSTNDFAIVRYNSTGSLDTGFDSDGKVTTDFGSGTDWGYSVALQLDGKIVVAGFGYVSSTKIAVARYTSNGSLDTDFDTDGKVTTAFGSIGDYGNCVAIQSDGKIIVAGLTYVSGSNADFALVRYTGSSGPLPVELTSFTGTAINNYIELKWETATEIDNYGFEIERSQNLEFSSQNLIWKNIGFVTGSGNSSSPKKYLFIDKTFFEGMNTQTSKGKYYYRLKQVDNNGSFEYSNIIEVNFSIPFKFALEQNYPNPFNPITRIKYQIAKNDFVTLKIFDVLGNEVATLVDEMKEPGFYEVEFNVEAKLTINKVEHQFALTSGIYFYQLKEGNFISTKKFILMK